jgi:hypothetical protein
MPQLGCKRPKKREPNSKADRGFGGEKRYGQERKTDHRIGGYSEEVFSPVTPPRRWKPRAGRFIKRFRSEQQ